MGTVCSVCLMPHCSATCPECHLRLNADVWPGAQIGFFGLLIVELVANKGLLDMLGFRTGMGLGFEF